MVPRDNWKKVPVVGVSKQPSWNQVSEKKLPFLNASEVGRVSNTEMAREMWK